VAPGLSGMMTRKYGLAGGAATLKARRNAGATERFVKIREAIVKVEDLCSAGARNDSVKEAGHTEYTYHGVRPPFRAIKVRYG
jgi:hypothetical protein